MYPANDSTLVQQLGEILGADLDVTMSLNNLDGEPYLPSANIPISIVSPSSSGLLPTSCREQGLHSCMLTLMEVLRDQRVFRLGRAPHL